MRFIDLFGGVGGFRLGIERATEGKWECVWYCDNDKYAVQTYNRNFKESYIPTDITKVEADSIPDFDILCAGFPCQSFSIAGKRKGFDDTRGTLFFEIARIAQIKRPKILFLENVKGLLSHDNGKTFGTILKALDELGYDVQWEVLNSKNFGVPQNRERVFIIGHLRGEPCPEVFPLGETSEEIPGLPKREISHTITSRYWKGTSPKHYFEKGKDTLIYDRKGFDSRTKGFRESMISPTLSVMMGTGGNNVPMVMAFLTPDRENKRQHGRRMMTGQDIHGVFNGTKIRRLTPTECERLQGFPDNWTQGVSDTQRYRQMGNAVTVNVIEVIARKLIEFGA